MKRAILIAAGSIAGAAAVLSYQPGSLFSDGAGVALAGEAIAMPVTTTTTTTASSTPTAASTPTAPATFTGDAVQTQFGTVQVEVTVDGSTISNVTAIAFPESDRKSAQISAFAIPELQQQAVTAQSASIDGVSGASYTSAGFVQSLQSALAQAGLA